MKHSKKNSNSLKTIQIPVILFFTIIFFSCDALLSQHLDENCPIKNFDHDKIRTCGYLQVPEFHNKFGENKIKIAYAVLKSNSSNPQPDPVVYLMGGPGGSSLNSIQFWARHPILSDRDLVLVDQRGTGFSKPTLCPELGSEMAEILGQDFNREQESKVLKDKAEACKSKIMADGIHLEAYNSRENAADLEALRKYLGYKKWNLYGGSYGTRLALTIMRDYPEGIRSVVLSGPFPPQANMYETLIPNFKSALNVLFEQCEAIESCRSSYPNLSLKFEQLIEKLKISPEKATYRDKPFYINAQDALLIIHQLLYSRNTAGRIPSFITGLLNNDQQDINRALVPLLLRAGAIDLGMYYSVQAYEEIPFNGKKGYEQSLQENAAFDPGLAFFNSDLDILPGWHHVSASNIENRAVESAIPTLIMVGKLDPITPEPFAHQTAEGLSNSEIVVFPSMSHNLLGYCPNKILLNFINNPEVKPNSDCRLENNFLIFD